jgi:hypothetical protein
MLLHSLLLLKVSKGYCFFKENAAKKIKIRLKNVDREVNAGK